MIKVTLLRQDEVNDYFEVIVDDTMQDAIYPTTIEQYRTYPRSMNARTDDIKDDVQEEFDRAIPYGAGNGINQANAMMNMEA